MYLLKNFLFFFPFIISSCKIAAIKDKFEDWREFLVKSLTGARTAPSFLLDKVNNSVLNMMVFS